MLISINIINNVLNMQLGEKVCIHIHICIHHADIHISRFVKDAPKNISTKTPFIPHTDSLPTYHLFLSPWSH